MPLDNFGIVKPGKLYRCAQPNLKGFQDLKTLGVNVILKLTEENEFPFANEQAAFSGTILSLSVSVFKLQKEELISTAHMIQHWIALEQTVAVHCKHGRDRTGAVIGAWRLLHDGWNMDQVQKERQEYGANWLIDIGDHEIVEVLNEIYRQNEQ